MFRNFSRIVVPAGVLWLGTFAQGAVAQSQPQVYSLDLPVTHQTTVNTCTAGEPVILNGTVHLQYSFTSDGSGVNRFVISVANDLHGVGQNSGSAYSASDSNVYTVNTTDASAQLTPDLQSDLTSQSGGIPLTLVQSIAIGADTSGNLTGQVNQNGTQCAN